MAKFGINDADNYGGNGAGYFTLKDDGDSAVVRFMYNTVDDIEGYAVHRIDVGNGRNRYVSCLREDYNQPMDDCPLCANRNFQQAKFFFNVFDCETEEVKLWERGKNILRQLVPVLNQIQGNICATPIKVIRRGIAGDQNTRYEFVLMKPDKTTLEDLPEATDPMEAIILSYSFDELNDYVRTGVLAGIENTFNNNTNNNNNSDNSIRRRYNNNTSNDNGGYRRGSTGNNNPRF